MLGTLEARNFIQETDGNGYAQALFGGIKGEIAYCRKNGDFMPHIFYRASGIVKARYAGVEDCYISMNTFFQNDRHTDKLKRLCNLYVDLDIYKSAYRDMPKEGIVQILRDEYIGTKIPEPTFIIDSGNGMYLIWHLRNEDRKALPRYLAIENYLIDTLSEFGADKACRDASRILRVPGTVNSKCQRTVRIMEQTCTAFSLYEIMREYEIKPIKTVYTAKNKKNKATVHPYGTATEKMRILAAKIAAERNVDPPDYENYQETFDFIRDFMPTHREDESPLKKCAQKIIRFADIRAKNFLLREYLTDIETLMTARTGEDCKREYALFLYRLFTQEATGNADFALSQTLALNQRLSCPLPEAYVIVRTKSAQKKIDGGDTYHYKKSTIIEALEITDEEMKSLPLCVLTTQVTAKERKAQANRRAYQKRLAEQGKETKKTAIMERREKIAAMLQAGDSPEHIMETLSISKATYYRDIAAMKIDQCVQAVETCVQACTHVAGKAERQITETVKNAAEAVKTAILPDSHIFSPTIINENAVGVPHSYGEFTPERKEGIRVAAGISPPPYPA